MGQIGLFSSDTAFFNPGHDFIATVRIRNAFLKLELLHWQDGFSAASQERRVQGRPTATILSLAHTTHRYTSPFNTMAPLCAFSPGFIS